MARPTKYLSDTERPISVSLRIPRDLYDQAQHLAHMRRTTFTEIVVEGLRLRLETPQDTTGILAVHDITVTQGLAQYIDARIQTVMQELEAMIDIRISAALATEGYTGATAPSPATAVASELVLLNVDNITAMQPCLNTRLKHPPYASNEAECPMCANNRRQREHYSRRKAKEQPQT